MLAVVDNNMDEIHRILLTDSTFINKKGFLHGWVRMDVVTKDTKYMYIYLMVTVISVS